MTLKDDLSCIETKFQGHEKQKALKSCLKCKKKAVILLPYGPQQYCAEHFSDLTERRVKKFIRQNDLINAKEKIVIALSGGKDSVLLLHLLNKFFKKSNKLQALIIDEGIPSYRDKSVKLAVDVCKKLDVDYTVIKFEDFFGISISDIVVNHLEKNPKLGTSCSFCGIMRRRIMNSFALKVKADKLATGHNLDDEDQSILMNIFDNNVQKFLRQGPKAGIKKLAEFVTRVKPLGVLPEKEIIAYCYFNNIKFHEDLCCPFSKEAKRNHFRSMLNEFEEKYPGTKHSVLNFFLELKLYLNTENEKKKKVIHCRKCLEISSGAVCNVCLKLDSLRNSGS